MDLKSHFSNLERGEAARIAREMGISASYLSQMVSGDAPISPQRAVTFERVLGGAVTRKDIYPVSQGGRNAAR
ncbi:helix-turn-helix domain-containing protein [Dechloromonas sp. CZR5]|uniref:transcriptional regulator n=1 Tax=Dechloromonas sp. CZR5 TaxID=2608630 RepID=UPI00123D4D71